MPVGEELHYALMTLYGTGPSPARVRRRGRPSRVRPPIGSHGAVCDGRAFGAEPILDALSIHKVCSAAKLDFQVDCVKQFPREEGEYTA